MSKTSATLRLWPTWQALLLASTAISWSASALAQEAQPQASSGGASEVIIVTAQKRSQNLQDVPMSVQALTTTQLEELGISDFKDFAQHVPSVSFAATYGPGYTRPFMRGVASGENGNHSGPPPSVGMYVDEQPITTPQGNLDLHVYDLARVEVLEGPQGTLYGASSQSGTIRLITNQPNTAGFEAGYDAEVNTVDHGGTGGVIQGFINVPISNRMAIRLVAWDEHDAGYIDNVHATRTYPTGSIVDDNAAFVKDDYNDMETYGARAALKIDLNDTWSVTPQIMTQRQNANGIFAQEHGLGDLQVAHWLPEYTNDRWTQSSLTVQGQISNFDVTFAASHLDRTLNSDQDYADYGYFYDVLYGSYAIDNNGDFINPKQKDEVRHTFGRTSYEFRVASPAESRLRFIGGLFYQDAEHHIHERYNVTGLADAWEVPGHPDTIWLTEQIRDDKEEALFGELSYDLTDHLTGTFGARVFHTEGTLEGFFGYGAGYSGSQGEATCFEASTVNGAPCNDLDKKTTEDGQLYRVNLQYRFDPEHMVYATFSQGFRPGGINRRGTLPPYNADYLDNYEAGWKTQWDNGRLRWNGAAFYENWRDFQFSFLGANGLTEIQNAGNARIIGVESDVSWYPIDNFSLTGSFTALDTELTDAAIERTVKGTQLPVSPNLKADFTARYEWNVGDLPAFAQTSISYQGESTLDIRTIDDPTRPVPLNEAAILGKLPSYWMMDASAGLDFSGVRFSVFVNNLTDERAVLSRYSECKTATCGGQLYDIVAQPRTIGIRIGQKF
ncbi:MAG: TonB-dependent receptor [Terricaulis silvestris]